MRKYSVCNGLSIALALCLNTAVAQAADRYPKVPLEELKLFSFAFHQIQRNYLYESSDAQLLENAIRGMLDGLDPHSAYLNKEERRELQIDTEGRFGGIGIEIEWRDGKLLIIAPIDDTPAARAGIKSGDRIIAIDKQPIDRLRFERASALLRGPPGSMVQLSIQRRGVVDPLSFELQREVVKIRSVQHSFPTPEHVYLRIARFQNDTAAEMHKILRVELDNDAHKARGMVLDLRDNPGGLMAAAVAVADLLLDGGDIVSTRGRGGKSLEIIRASRGDLSHGLPIVVLINAGTASAAEVVAGALQDRRRALLVGNQSFGKGSVQSIIPLPQGQALKMTTALYYTPNGRSIQATGIEPDIHVEHGKWNQRPLPSFLREQDLPGHLPPPDTTADGKVPVSPSPQLDHVAREDYQLHAALLILRGMDLSQTFAPTRKLPPQ